VCGKYKALFSHEKMGNLKRLVEETTNLFTGKHPDFLLNTLKNYDYEHTLQAALCLVHLLAGRHFDKAAPRLKARQS